MTQLTDKIREAIIGNVGTVIAGRIGITDAEILVKKFEPVFTSDDMTKMPNFQGMASVMINNTPSAPFSMSFTPPMVHANERLADAMKKLSATKYGRPRVQVEAEIKRRTLSSARPATQQLPGGQPGAKPPAGGSSFLDEWLAKRQRAGVQRPGVVRQPSQPSIPNGGGYPPAPFSAQQSQMQPQPSPNQQQMQSQPPQSYIPPQVSQQPQPGVFPQNQAVSPVATEQPISPSQLGTDAFAQGSAASPSPQQGPPLETPPPSNGEVVVKLR
jgi:hypothetical protein